MSATRRALWLLVASACCFGAMAFTAKLAAASGIGGGQVTAMRFAVGLTPFALPGIRRRALRWQRVDLLVYRGVFGGTAVLLYFLAIAHVPVGLATLLNYTSPIFSGFFAALFLGERAPRRVVVPLAVALAGVYLVVRSHGGGEEWRLGSWVLVGAASAVLSGAALAAIRAARRTEGSWTIYGSFSLFGLITAAPLAISGWVRPDRAQWLLLVGVGLLSLAAQLTMTYAYRWVDNVRAGVISQLAVFVAMGLGASFLGESVTWMTVLGSLLTVGAVVSIVLAGRRAPAAVAGA